MSEGVSSILHVCVHMQGEDRVRLPSKVTGISSGATTSMAIVCSYVFRFKSCIRGRLCRESVSSSSLSYSSWLFLRLLVKMASSLRVAAEALARASSFCWASGSRRVRRLRMTK
jgi:hypothetical protein